MASVRGKQLRCDRCGKIEFAEFIGTEERDGGYTWWNKFKDPDRWTSAMINGIGRGLCPDCSDLHRQISIRQKQEWEHFMEVK